MHWSSALSRRPTLDDALEDCVSQVQQGMAERPVDLLFFFASPQFAQNGTTALRSRLPSRVLLGCTGGGIIGAGFEVEDQPALSLLAAHLPEVAIHPFHLDAADLPDPDSPPDAWETLVGVPVRDRPQFVLLPNGANFPIDACLSGLDFAYPGSVKVGGLTSGGSQPGHNVLFLEQHSYRRGLVGVALSGNITMDAVVAQGCRPIANTYQITRCERHMLWELDGEPALQVLQGIVRHLDDHDRQLVTQGSLFIGVLMDEFKATTGQGDFLIRNLMGIDPRSGGIAVGDWLRNGQTIRFHLRDAHASEADMRMVLERYSQQTGGHPHGAVLFSCLGRGEGLYSQLNFDSNLFSEMMNAEIPMAGFFCNGEIGPVGGTTFLHGYTSSFGLFRPAHP